MFAMHFHGLARRVRLVALLAGVACAQSCLWVEGDGRVFVTSNPQGAEVLLDGKPTGQTTPATLDLGGPFADNHVVTVRKPGFEPEDRIVSHYTKMDTSKWNDGAADYGVWSFPIFWTFGDFAFPFELRWTYVPHNLFVRLFREGTFQPKPGRTRAESGTR